MPRKKETKPAFVLASMRPTSESIVVGVKHSPMCAKCNTLMREIRRCRAGTPHRDRKDYYRRYYRQNKEKKIAAATARYWDELREKVRKAKEEENDSQQYTAQTKKGTLSEAS